MSIYLIADAPVQPLFRWVGGKQRLVPRLLPLLPEEVATRPYIEPFFGGGSLFFSICPRKSLICDANTDLIACYEYVRDNPASVHRYVRQLAMKNRPSHYYRLRDEFNQRGWSYRKAALFIYLNKTCFNGIYRVNQRNEFNVPFGHKANPQFPSLEHLRSVSLRLTDARLRAGDYRIALSRIPKQAFVYLDPPYPALNGTAYFTHYTDDRFLPDDQLELAEHVHRLSNAGTLFMMTNADTPLIRETFAGFNITKLNVPRWVSCKGTKLRVDELVIRNY